MTRKPGLTAALVIICLGMAMEADAGGQETDLVKLAQFDRLRGGENEHERQEFCRVYASAAVEQQHRNLNEGCHYSGARWNDNSGDHFSWCMIYPREAQQEARERDRLLKQCSAADGDLEDRGKRAACEHYARVTVTEAQSNARAKCGYAGPRWANDRKAHFDWCMTQRPGAPDEEISGRERDLALCFAQADDFADYADDCDGFARRAVQQNDRNVFLRCGFRGTEWTSDYSIHHEFCRQAAREQRLDFLRGRARRLQNCQSE